VLELLSFAVWVGQPYDCRVHAINGRVEPVIFLSSQFMNPIEGKWFRRMVLPDWLAYDPSQDKPRASENDARPGILFAAELKKLKWPLQLRSRSLKGMRELSM